MATDPKSEWLGCLPSFWNYGVTRDGRIFFINEEAQSTAWLHPVTGEAVVTGHRKTPDLPTGWEEGYTFEGARCFINHPERKVTCKHPVSGIPSQDNCIFVVNEQSIPKVSSENESRTDKKERPKSDMSEASNYTGGSDYSTFPGSPATIVTSGTTVSTSSTRPSRSSKKIHNFGKRSNSIKRNIYAPVVKCNWLFKQDSTGMKLWKKRWFVLSDMCLFYYRDEKEDSILGSILLPSFHISMLSVDDHINKKYAFKATHPNMRTYYFCTDTAKEMESWMKVMTDAALVHTEPIRRLDKLNMDQQKPQDLNNFLNHKVLTGPEIQKNDLNRDPVQQQIFSQANDKGLKDSEKHNSQKEHGDCTFQRDEEKFLLKKDEVGYRLQKNGEKYFLHKDGERLLLKKDMDNCSLQKDGKVYIIDRYLDKLADHQGKIEYTMMQTEEKYDCSKDEEKNLITKNGQKYVLPKFGQKDGQKLVPQKEVRRQLSLKETERHNTVRDMGNKYGTIQVVDKYSILKKVGKYSTLREGDKYTITDAEKYATLRNGNMFGFQKINGAERTLAKTSSIRLQPIQAAAITPAVSVTCQNQANIYTQKPAQFHGSGSEPEKPGDASHPKVDDSHTRISINLPGPVLELDSGLSRTVSINQLQPWVSAQRPRGLEDDTRSVTSYQTLPKNMPSHRAQNVPRYPKGYRTLPRNSMMRPESICSVAGAMYDQAIRPPSTTTVTTAEKRRSMRDDTMWQLYEWQQRQAFSRQSLAQPTGHCGTLPRMKVMGIISERGLTPSIPTSPSHGSLERYSTFSPPPQQDAQNPSISPVLRRSMTLDRRHWPHLTKCDPPSEQRLTTHIPSKTITQQSLQGKTPEELTLLLIKLRRQQAEINSLREHTVAQLMALGGEGPNAKTDVLSHHLQRNLNYLDSQTKGNEPLIFMIHTLIENLAPRPQLYQQINPDNFKDGLFQQHTAEADIDAKLSKLCEQDKAVKTQEEKLQQLHREKHTLETALLSASQELSEHGGSSTAAIQSLVQQRDVLQSGLLSTCRELSRVNAELEGFCRMYDQLEADVTSAKTDLLEQLEALGSPQTEPPSQRHIRIQKELWKIQDVMEALSKNKNKTKQSTESFSFPGFKPLSSLQKNEQAPDYRLYKSEPELTTVKEEMDEHNEDKEKAGTTAESKDTPTIKVSPFPVGIVTPRTKSSMNPPESSTIASYVTLRKTKKPDSRSDRPRSSVDQMGFGEREVFRTRMSVEEQLERIKRNQEASFLREKKRESSSRSSSFITDNPFSILQKVEEVKHANSEEVQHEKVEDKQQTSSDSRSEVVIGELGIEPKYVETVNFQPCENERNKQELTNFSTKTATENSFHIPSPGPKDQEMNQTQQNFREEINRDSYKQLTTDGTNYSNLMASQSLTLVNSDT
ncbi:pleckstrin homology domain-containing family A member 5 isoform X2 [Austrofundulus limnaeus]|uniref:Pleckstrin homology domain-containing family A member 5 isoform X2 n=1 Tax=Austrofundulus limnaeus TaxID=52670 RepID=A0A2I4CUH7_AUSLI|nr:PREDICTED: pleckstrin homology domain-containing family A member 5-like isoform X2 [Austrofundulus limnaeus]